MRFSKGSKVEIFSTKEVPIGAWHCAEIISGNGHNYTVKYSFSPAVERVPRKVIRPCPPPREGNYISGDVIEVFHNLSWKICEVIDVIDYNYFLVRVFGLNLELSVHKSLLRIRQCFQEGEWFVIGKITSDSIRVLKRKFVGDGSCSFEQKRIRVCKNINCDDKGKFEGNFVDSRVLRGNSVCEDSVSTLSGDCYDCCSSVGSCSAIGGDTFRVKERDDGFEDDCASDAESSCRWGIEKFGVECCRSELVDYQYAIQKLYISGLLSWEDEAKLTNLREQLQITDDEHLMAKLMGRKKPMLPLDLQFSVFDACVSCF